MVADFNGCDADTGIDRPWVVSGDLAVLAGHDQRLSVSRLPTRLQVFFGLQREMAHRVEPIRSPWGPCLLSFGSKGVLSLSFLSDASLHTLPEDIHPLFRGEIKELALQLVGTPFQHAVWKALLSVPRGQTCTYASLAQKIGRPQAARAVGSAVGQNPIAWIVPCHRILPASGGLGGFRWGVGLKKELLTADAYG